MHLAHILLISDKESLSSILKRAGGLTSKALQDEFLFTEKKNFMLMFTMKIITKEI